MGAARYGSRLGQRCRRLMRGSSWSGRRRVLSPLPSPFCRAILSHPFIPARHSSYAPVSSPGLLSREEGLTTPPTLRHIHHRQRDDPACRTQWRLPSPRRADSSAPRYAAQRRAVLSRMFADYDHRGRERNARSVGGATWGVQEFGSW